MNPGQMQLPGSSAPQGFSFHDNAIISREKDSFSVFEPKCTHLGCVINQEIDGEMVCACHGSSFDKEGKPLSGPAVTSLKKLEHSFDNDRDILTINL